MWFALTSQSDMLLRVLGHSQTVICHPCLVNPTRSEVCTIYRHCSWKQNNAIKNLFGSNLISMRLAVGLFMCTAWPSTARRGRVIAEILCLPYLSWLASLSHAIDVETLWPIFLYWVDALRVHEERSNRPIGSEYYLFGIVADEPDISTINSKLLVGSVCRYYPAYTIHWGTVTSHTIWIQNSISSWLHLQGYSYHCYLALWKNKCLIASSIPQIAPGRIFNWVASGCHSVTVSCGIPTHHRVKLITGHVRYNWDTNPQKFRFNSSHAGEMMALQYTGPGQSSDIRLRSCTWLSARSKGILRYRTIHLACSFSTAEIQHHSTNVCNQRFVLT